MCQGLVDLLSEKAFENGQASSHFMLLLVFFSGSARFRVSYVKWKE